MARRPGKLNTNLAINVAALLPGAKRPNFKTVNENPDFVDVPSANQVINTQQNPDRLANLTKSRVKIHVKRRPSTRTGRKESYVRSLGLDSEDESSENQDSRTDDYSSNANSTSSNKPTSNETKEAMNDVTVRVENIEEIFTPQDIAHPGEQRFDFPPSLIDEKLPEAAITSKFEGNSLLSKTKVFNDSEDDDDDDDWLVQATKKLNNNEKTLCRECSPTT